MPRLPQVAQSCHYDDEHVNDHHGSATPTEQSGSDGTTDTLFRDIALSASVTSPDSVTAAVHSVLIARAGTGSLENLRPESRDGANHAADEGTSGVAHRGQSSVAQTAPRCTILIPRVIGTDDAGTLGVLDETRNGPISSRTGLHNIAAATRVEQTLPTTEFIWQSVSPHGDGVDKQAALVRLVSSYDSVCVDHVLAHAEAGPLHRHEHTPPPSIFECGCSSDKGGDQRGVTECKVCGPALFTESAESAAADTSAVHRGYPYNEADDLDEEEAAWPARHRACPPTYLPPLFYRHADHNNCAIYNPIDCITTSYSVASSAAASSDVKRTQRSTSTHERMVLSLQHLLECCLPQDAEQQLREILDRHVDHTICAASDAVTQRSADAAVHCPPPPWVAMFAHTRALSVPLASRASAVLRSGRASAHVTAVPWPTWVPDQVTSLAALEALAVAALTLVNDIAGALSLCGGRRIAQSDIAQLLRCEEEEEEAEGRGEDQTAQACASFTALCEAVFGREERTHLARIIKARFPAVLSRSDLLGQGPEPGTFVTSTNVAPPFSPERLAPADHVPHHHRDSSHARDENHDNDGGGRRDGGSGGNSSRRGCRRDRCGNPLTPQSPDRQTGHGIPPTKAGAAVEVVWPSVLRVMHHMAFTFMETLFPSVAAQLQKFLCRTLRQLPCLCHHQLPPCSPRSQPTAPPPPDQSGGGDTDDCTFTITDTCKQREGWVCLHHFTDGLAWWSSWWSSRRVGAAALASGNALRMSVTVTSAAVGALAWVVTNGHGGSVQTTARLLSTLPLLMTVFVNAQEVTSMLGRLNANLAALNVTSAHGRKAARQMAQRYFIAEVVWVSVLLRRLCHNRGGGGADWLPRASSLLRAEAQRVVEHHWGERLQTFFLMQQHVCWRDRAHDGDWEPHVRGRVNDDDDDDDVVGQWEAAVHNGVAKAVHRYVSGALRRIRAIRSRLRDRRATAMAEARPSQQRGRRNPWALTGGLSAAAPQHQPLPVRPRGGWQSIDDGSSGYSGRWQQGAVATSSMGTSTVMEEVQNERTAVCALVGQSRCSEGDGGADNADDDNEEEEEDDNDDACWTALRGTHVRYFRTVLDALLAVTVLPSRSHLGDGHANLTIPDGMGSPGLRDQNTSRRTLEPRGGGDGGTLPWMYARCAMAYTAREITVFEGAVGEKSGGGAGNHWSSELSCASVSSSTLSTTDADLTVLERDMVTEGGVGESASSLAAAAASSARRLALASLRDSDVDTQPMSCSTLSFSPTSL